MPFRLTNDETANQNVSLGLVWFYQWYGLACYYLTTLESTAGCPHLGFLNTVPQSANASKKVKFWGRAG